MSNYQKTIAIDFDGVIHAYSKGWHDGTCYDEPVEGAKEALERLCKRGYHIVIFTCRAETEQGTEDVLAWCLNNFHDLVLKYGIEITDKKPKAIAYIDDDRHTMKSMTEEDAKVISERTLEL